MTDATSNAPRLSIAAALAFAGAVAAARRESALLALVEGISELSAADRHDELASRISWAPAYLWGHRDANGVRHHLDQIEAAGYAGLSAGLVAAEVLSLGRARLGDGSGPVEARHIETSDAIFVALASAIEAENHAVACALSIVLEAIENGDVGRLAAFFSEADVSAASN